jgi:hypothetical protein
MDGIDRGSQYGYSLYRMGIFESSGTNTLPFVSGEGEDTVELVVGNTLNQGLSQYFSDNTTGDAFTYDAMLNDASDFVQLVNAYSSKRGKLTSDEASIEHIGDYTIEIEATDRYGASVSTSFLLIVREETTAVFDASLADNITVYPNPANEYVTIDQAGSWIDNISIFDVQGSEIKSMRNVVSGGEITIPVSGIQPGVYYIVMHAGQQQIVRKLIKQ